MSYPRSVARPPKPAAEIGCLSIIAILIVNAALWAALIVGGIWLAVKTLEWVGVL